MAFNILRLRNKKTGQFDPIPVLVGEPAKLVSQVQEYRYDTQGVTPPTDGWLPEVPPVERGRYLWTRIQKNWNKGVAYYDYSVAYQGQDGLGTVNSILNVQPDPVTHDVDITRKLVDLILPVGHVEIGGESPQIRFPWTEWEKQAEGSFISAAGDSRVEGSTGGSKEHTHDIKGFAKILTAGNMLHYQFGDGGAGSETWESSYAATCASYTDSDSSSQTDGVPIKAVASSVSNEPVNIAFNIWRRVK